MLSAAQLLDELMGRDRNLAPDEKRCNVRWDDETVSEMTAKTAAAIHLLHTHSSVGH